MKRDGVYTEQAESRLTTGHSSLFTSRRRPFHFFARSRDGKSEKIRARRGLPGVNWLVSGFPGIQIQTEQ